MNKKSGSDKLRYSRSWLCRILFLFASSRSGRQAVTRGKYAAYVLWVLSLAFGVCISVRIEILDIAMCSNRKSSVILPRYSNFSFPKNNSARMLFILPTNSKVYSAFSFSASVSISKNYGVLGAFAPNKRIRIIKFYAW